MHFFLVPLTEVNHLGKFNSILVLLTFFHLHMGSPMSEGHPKDFSSAGTFNFISAGTINFSSAVTFFHLNAISYAFSSVRTFLYFNAISYAFSSTGTFNFSNLF